MNTRHLLRAAPWLLLLPVAQGMEYRLLHGLNRLDQALLTWGQPLTDKSLVLCTDPERRSEGTGSLHLRGLASDHKGNQYLGVKVVVPPTDLEERRVCFDVWTTTPDATQAIYVRYYNRKGETVCSWNNWSSPFVKRRLKTVVLRTGVSRRGFRHEDNVVSGSPCTDVAAIEIIIGTREKGAPFDIFIDRIEVSAEPVASALALPAPKRLYLDTELVSAGQARAVIVSPGDSPHRAVAERVADGIRERAGVALPIVGPMEPDAMAKTHAIVLGTVNTNPSLAPLYGHYYTAADAVFPGPGGFVLRTIHDPWGTGANVVLLAGSTADDVGRAADALLGRLKPGPTLVLAPAIQVALGRDPTGSLAGLATPPREDYVQRRVEAARRALDRGAHGGITGMVADAGLRYYHTGQRAYAEAFKGMVYLMYEHVQSKPKTFGGPWGMDADFRLYRMMPAWDLVEESDVFTDADRLKITQIYAEYIGSCVGHAHSVLGSDHMYHNHQTFPSLGLLYAGSYFKKYYAAEEADYWLEIADACFQRQARGSKPYEDCNGYQWLTGYHTIKYALARPHHPFFYSHHAQRLADYALLCMDNLGYQVPYGDTGSYQCWWTELPYLRSAAWLTGDGRYHWALAKKAQLRPRVGLNEYAADRYRIEPVDLLGTRAFAVDPRYYASWSGPEGQRGQVVDKVVMRASFDADRQYLLLDGLSNGGHKHYDGNSISRITDRGRIWLADNDYLKCLPKYHNGVLVFRDGQSDIIPPWCELEQVADMQGLGFSQTVLRGYAGADWRRGIVWLKERYFVVIDEMVARQGGAFSFRALWHTVGDARAGADGLEVEQKGKRFFIRHPSGIRTRLYDDEELGTNWRGYPYAEPVVRVFQQIAKADLAEGQSYRFFNLLHGSDDDRPQDFRLQQLSPTCAAVTGDAPAIVGLGRAMDEPILPGAAAAAAMLHLSADGFALVSATGFEWPGLGFAADRPVNVEARAGSARIVAGEPTRVELAAPGEVTVTGRVGRVERRPGRVVLHGVTGECEVQGVRTELEGLAARIDRALAARKPPAVKPAAAERGPELPLLWSLREKLDAYLLTDNAGSFEAVDVGAAVTCSPAPLPANVFSAAADGTNNLASLTDGALRTTQGCVMWDTDQPVVLDFDLVKEYTLTRLRIKAWWASSSSKDETYQLGRAVVEVSRDGFARDRRRAGELADEADHGNWGAPGYGPKDYDVDLAGARARYVRISLTPRKGTGIYIAELEIWGNREGLEIDLATQRERGLPVHVFHDLHAADVDRDGGDELVAGSSNGSVYLVASDGATRWKVDAGSPVYAVTTAQFEPGQRTVVAGTADGRLLAIAASGEKRWDVSIPLYKRTAVVRTVFPADLDGDGRDEVAVGAESWRYYAFDRDGKQLWQYESVRRASVGAAADLDLDGKDEVLAGTVYYWWSCIRPDGTKRWGYSSRSGPMAKAVAAGNIAGDGKLEVLFGAADSYVHALDAAGKLLWKFNTGDEVTSVETCDLDRDGLCEVLVGSKSFNVYALDGRGQPLWRVDLDDEVTGLVVLRADPPLIAAATGAGQVCVLDRSGRLVAHRVLPAKPLRVAAADLDRDGRSEIVAACADGGMYAVAAPAP